MEQSTKTIGPFPGMQTLALESKARVVITGGKAGPGKTYGMLFPPLYFLKYKIPTSCIIFRPMSQDLMDDGGIMKDARDIYLPFGATAREPPTADFRWNLGQGKRLSVKFAALSKAGDERKHMGPERGYIAFDQLELFMLRHFRYLFTRARAKKEQGFEPWVHATVNPVVRGDPMCGWIREFVDWWIADDGFPDPGRRGKVRYFVGAPDDYPDPFVVDTKENLLKKWPKSDPISMTFIHGERLENPLVDWTAYDQMLGVEEQWVQDQLREGNWNVGPKDATKIWDVPSAVLFEDGDADFQAALHAPGPVDLIGWWDYGRSAKALAWGIGLLQPGSPPTLWTLAGIVWTNADVKQAALDRAVMIEYLAGRFGVTIGVDDVRDAGDPSGEYRTGPGETWGQALRSLGVPIQPMGPIVLPRDQGSAFLNSDFGFTLRVKIVQQWLGSGRLRVRSREPEAEVILMAMRSWAYDVPEGVKIVDVNRQFVRPRKDAPSHVGDALTYGVALVHDIVERGKSDAPVISTPPPRTGGLMGGRSLGGP